MGMPAHAHSALLALSSTLLRHRCALLSASWITVSTLFKLAPIKCFCWWNEGQLTLLNFPKEVSTSEFVSLDLFCKDLFTSST